MHRKLRGRSVQSAIAGGQRCLASGDANKSLSLHAICPPDSQRCTWHRGSTVHASAARASRRGIARALLRHCFGIHVRMGLDSVVPGLRLAEARKATCGLCFHSKRCALVAAAVDSRFRWPLPIWLMTRTSLPPILGGALARPWACPS